MSFSAGQVLTAAQLNDLDIDSLTVDTNVLVVDKTNDRVGIGTASPSQLLDVRGIARVGDDTDRTPDAQGTGHLMIDGNGYGGYVSLDADAMWVGNNASSRAVYLATDETARLTVAGGGDVGIGTTSPSQRLHVNSGGDNTTSVFESTDSIAYIGIKDSASSSDIHVAIGAVGDEMRLRANNGNRVTITGSTFEAGVPVQGPDGSAGTPSYSFNTDTNTGMYRRAADEIGFTTGGVERFRVGSFGIRGDDSGNVYNWNRFQGNNGSAASPTYTFDSDTDTGMYRSGTNEISFSAGNDTVFTITSGGVFVPSGEDYFGVPTTGTGNDAEWSSTGFGTYLLRRNSSLTAEKENITADLGTHLTADMIDSVVPKMWNRLNSPGFPEIGPLAEDMDAISPFLAAHGADITDGTYQHFLTGINKTAYLSLLVLAVKDLRTRVAALEA